jgi:hypothetical protein
MGLKTCHCGCSTRPDSGHDQERRSLCMLWPLAHDDPQTIAFMRHLCDNSTIAERFLQILGDGNWASNTRNATPKLPSMTDNGGLLDKYLGALPRCSFATLTMDGRRSALGPPHSTRGQDASPACQQEQLLARCAHLPPEQHFLRPPRAPRDEHRRLATAPRTTSTSATARPRRCTSRSLAGSSRA